MRRFVLLVTFALLLTSVALVAGQDSTPPAADPGLRLAVGSTSCGLALAAQNATPEATRQAVSIAAFPTNTPAASTPELTPAPSYLRLVLGSDCDLVNSNLHVPINDVLWIMLSMPNEPQWQQFAVDPSDAHPPQLDRRGRFIGCSIPVRGAQTCRVLWEHINTTYSIEIPITVRQAYVAPRPTSVPLSTAAPVPVSTPNNSGVWGSCGSCTTCGGPVEHCVLAPDNTCVWDAFRCERPNPQ